MPDGVLEGEVRGFFGEVDAARPPVPAEVVFFFGVEGAGFSSTHAKSSSASRSPADGVYSDPGGLALVSVDMASGESSRLTILLAV